MVQLGAVHYKDDIVHCPQVHYTVICNTNGNTMTDMIYSTVHSYAYTHARHGKLSNTIIVIVPWQELGVFCEQQNW